MLLLVDLDNTLVDRATAFNSWASGFVRSLGGSAAETSWLIAADRDGYEPRESRARAIEERFESGLGIQALVRMLLFDHVTQMTMDAATTTALQNAREAGWKIGVVTNGTTEQQTRKVREVGLGPFVDSVVISEAVGVKKPDAEIFRIAAGRLGSSTSGGWMIGDHPTADIAGGSAAGLKTGWVSRGRKWPSVLAAPDLAAATAADVINAVVLSAT